MSIDIHELRALPAEEKLRLVELLWDDLGESDVPISLPAWIEVEAQRRRNEMSDPDFGISHDEVWRRIGQRHG